MTEPAVWPFDNYNVLHRHIPGLEPRLRRALNALFDATYVKFADTLFIAGTATSPAIYITGPSAAAAVYVNASVPVVSEGLVLGRTTTVLIVGGSSDPIDPYVKVKNDSIILYTDQGIAVGVSITNTGAVVFNESGGAVDFRVEGDTATNLFVVSGAGDAVQIGTTVVGAIASFFPTVITFNDGGADQDFRVEGDTATNLFICDAGLDSVQIGTTVAGALATFTPTAIIFNDAGNPNVSFRVEGDTEPNLLYVDAASDRVGIGTAGPEATFTVRDLFSVAVGGKVSRYEGTLTEGKGLPPILDVVSLTGQTASIASTNCTNCNVAGLYRAAFYLVCTTADAAAGSITLDLTYNDGTAARTLTSTSVALTSTANYTTLFTSTIADGTLIRLGSGSIAYSTTLTGSIGTAQYAIYLVVERLS